MLDNNLKKIVLCQDESKEDPKNKLNFKYKIYRTFSPNETYGVPNGHSF